MKKLILFLLLFQLDTKLMCQTKAKSVDGICLFTKYSPNMFSFIKTSYWHVTNFELMEIINSKFSHIFMAPYRGFINDNVYENTDIFYFQTISKRGSSTYQSYYCNCKLIFLKPLLDEKKLDEKFNKRTPFYNIYNDKHGDFLYRNHTRGLFKTQVDSVILFYPSNK